MKKLLLLVVFFTCLIAQAQLPTYIGAKFSQGVIAPHRPEMRYFIKKPIKEYNLQFGYQTTGNKDWQRNWGYPELGFGFYYANLENTDVLGSSKATYLYIDAPFFRGNILSLNYFFGIGTAYLSKPFDYKTNNTNIAIGSHLNIFANLNIETQIRTRRIIYFTDIGLTHYSNGGTKFPNLGLNVPAISVGLKYKTADFNKHKKMSTGFWEKYKDLQIIQTFAVHGNKLSISAPPEFMSTSSIDYGIYVSPKSRLGGGLDLMYDKNIENHFIADSIFNSKPINYLTAGAHFSYNAVFGNVQFTIQQLFMVYTPHSSGFFYQRFGLKLFIAENWIVGGSLLTKFFNAVAIEPSIGYRFH
ncbi:MAG: acyloxyacyl hydrolase [Bacteroidales bacterium]|nr:acyloxyacyl hydrolase [Bacteroidales bacterium]